MGGVHRIVFACRKLIHSAGMWAARFSGLDSPMKIGRANLIELTLNGDSGKFCSEQIQRYVTLDEWPNLRDCSSIRVSVRVWENGDTQNSRVVFLEPLRLDNCGGPAHYSHVPLIEQLQDRHFGV